MKNRKNILLKGNKDDIEELTVLLESLHIKDIDNYIIDNNYLLKKDIFSTAKTISLVFNEEKDYYNTKKRLTKNKYAIISKKGGV